MCIVFLLFSTCFVLELWLGLDLFGDGLLYADVQWQKGVQNQPWRILSVLVANTRVYLAFLTALSCHNSRASVNMSAKCWTMEPMYRKWMAGYPACSVCPSTVFLLFSLSRDFLLLAGFPVGISTWLQCSFCSKKLFTLLVYLY